MVVLLRNRHRNQILRSPLPARCVSPPWAIVEPCPFRQKKGLFAASLRENSLKKAVGGRARRRPRRDARFSGSRPRDGARCRSGLAHDHAHPAGPRRANRGRGRRYRERSAGRASTNGDDFALGCFGRCRARHRSDVAGPSGARLAALRPYWRGVRMGRPDCGGPCLPGRCVPRVDRSCARVAASRPAAFAGSSTPRQPRRGWRPAASTYRRASGSGRVSLRDLGTKNAPASGAFPPSRASKITPPIAAAGRMAHPCPSVPAEASGAGRGRARRHGALGNDLRGWSDRAIPSPASLATCAASRSSTSTCASRWTRTLRRGCLPNRA